MFSTAVAADSASSLLWRAVAPRACHHLFQTIETTPPSTSPERLSRPSKESSSRNTSAPRRRRLLCCSSGSTTSSNSSSSSGSSWRKEGMGDRDFPLSPNSVLKIQKGDITAWSANGSSDAIVNAANERMLGGGGVDGAIHRVAGPELRAACWETPEVRPGVRCPTGEARITPAFRLPVAHVIHTVGPIYHVDAQPEVTLGKSYRSCLKLAKDNGIDYIAFPAISCGVYGYPYKEAARVSISTLRDFSDDIKEVHFVLFSDEIYQAWLESARELL